MHRFTAAEVNVKTIIKAGGYTNSCKCIVEKLRVQSGNEMSSAKNSQYFKQQY
jgi:hypothetical protein